MQASGSARFTRGEKCILVHTVVTIAAIAALVAAYFVHAWMTHRAEPTALHTIHVRANISQASPADAVEGRVQYRCVGAALVLREDGSWRAACGTAALHGGWSLAPARCVAARANPHLAHLLPQWLLRYDEHRMGVRRGVVHPHYEGEGAAADVGLFEHERALPPSELDEPPFCAVPSATFHEAPDAKGKADLIVVGWRVGGERSTTRASLLAAAQCAQLAAPVAPAAASSLCLRPGNLPLPSPLLGALVFESSELVGLASWGGDHSLPLVVVDIAAFKFWLETTMKLLI